MLKFLILVCYLGYGSPARLLPPAIKKVISVPSEMACKKECIRFRETTPFKCFAFSFSLKFIIIALLLFLVIGVTCI